MSDLNELEHQRTKLKELVAQRDQVQRLFQNSDFKKLVVEAYFVTESARLVHLSSDPTASKEDREDALNMAQAAGHLKRYFRAIEQMGNVAAAQLPDYEEAIEEARAQEVTN
ncbi:hypothetical protein [Rhizobium phage RHph_X2_28B]|uniref:hypothetical protein n=1 Tax=Rhizobium phage RHph_X2_28B TaxID=2836086 RepID=UPI0023297F96|nr:hypothetical protein PP751_gp076 [Rhizobium phage RHph_X2_28B]QWY83528.1 hypothetical protein [Rhizobium phage RHph_X2_28B]QWY83764.1 hypothetical protein [Rhizobium phage RHph_X3_15]